MTTGMLYFLVIVMANSIGSIAGMGGGVLIKPLFDTIGVDSVATISFYSTVAVFTVAMVSTARQIRSGIAIEPPFLLRLSLGAIVGGILGKTTLEELLQSLPEQAVLTVQIGLTVLILLFAIWHTRAKRASWHLQGTYWQVLCGLLLGFLASLLGIGGGPINVSLLMLMFGMPIKPATVYSICIILFAQAAKLLSLIVTHRIPVANLPTLVYIIPAAVIGGLIGSRLSHVLPANRVMLIFQTMLVVVIGINIYNGLRLLF